MQLDLAAQVGLFFGLTPDTVLNAVDTVGARTTGRCYPLNSLENRVYELELEDDSRVVAKFYRPGRWSAEAIADEHALLFALQEAEIPVCAPIRAQDGSSLHRTEEGFLFTVFPRTGGRSPDELRVDEYEQLGRLLGRIHNVSASLNLAHRSEISPATYGSQALQLIQQHCDMAPGVGARFDQVARQVVELCANAFGTLETFVVHGDCHRANLLKGREGFFFLDFDDCARGPAVQDLWLLLPGRPEDCPIERDAILNGYEQFRELPPRLMRLVEPLRALRYLRYAAWIASRWQDPAFKRAFDSFGSDRYWEGLVLDLNEQLHLIQGQ